jgi:UDP-N-acetylglucosamine 2-epimerase
MIHNLKKILVLAGTRPEAIKLIPVIRELLKSQDTFQVRVCNTGQHKEMIEQVFKDFDISPDINLNIMRSNQTLADLSSRLFISIEKLLNNEKPDWILLQGDTTTAMVASMCAYYQKIKIGHVEAGLRSFDKWAPFPEEINRRVTGLVADIHFAPTQMARENLLNEGIHGDRIFVTGNTVIDVFLDTLILNQQSPVKLPEVIEKGIESSKRIILITGHRRENFGKGLERICLSIRELAKLYPYILFVYPVHLNPNVQKPVQKILGSLPNIYLTNPLPYKPFVRLINESSIILTDSGGIQEEAPSAKIPVLIMREVTERPEGLEAGSSKLVGSDPDNIINVVSELLENQKSYEKMVVAENPFGDGQAAKRIIEILKRQSV